MRKQYIFNNKIPHNTCLCEVCENTTLLGKGLNQACNVKKIPSDPHAIVEEYSCCSDSKDCMMSSCNDCKSHGLTAEDFEEQQQKQSAEESDSASDSASETFDSVKFLQWKRGADGYLTKVRTEVDIAEALGLWQSMVEVLKAHIYTKRRQFFEIRRITENLNEGELLIHLDYSENYKCKHQNEIQSAYFGNKSFSLFTACTYYCKDANIQKLPITVTTEENDKSRIASMSCVNKVITHSMEKIQQIISTVFIVSDGCASQFRSRFVFSLLAHIQQGIQIQWHYNEAHHGKGPMDGIGGTIKNLIFRRVLSEDVVINTPKEFATFADQISNIDCLFLEKDELLEEPEDVANASPIPSTLKVHKVIRVANRQNTFSNYFFYLSEDSEPFHTQKYGVQCGHEATDVDNDSICNHCRKEYIAGEEWLQCPICVQWYHEDCFYV